MINPEDMKETKEIEIRWSTCSQDTRQELCKAAGWVTRNGKLSPAGRRIASTEWDDLTVAGRSVLFSHGIIK